MTNREIFALVIFCSIVVSGERYESETAKAIELADLLIVKLKQEGI